MVKKNSDVKKVKKEKVEGAPKKNKSSYLFFCEEERPKIVKEKPDISYQNIMSELGARWKSLEENHPDKIRFNELALKDKERYVKEKQEFDSNDSAKSEDSGESESKDSDKKTKKKGGSKKKTDDGEKTEKKTKVNGYINYCNKHRAEYKSKNPNVQPKDITRALAAEWKLLSDEVKDSYKY